MHSRPTPAENGALENGTLEGKAWGALRTVFDPELGIDVVSLGLVYSVNATDDAIIVEMTLTTIGCPAAESLPLMAKAAVRDGVGGDLQVEVNLVWEPPWDPSMINADR